MIALSPTLLGILLGVLATLSVFTIFVIILFILGKRKTVKILRKLRVSVEEQADATKDLLKQHLVEKAAIPDDELDGTANECLQSRKTFYDYIVRTFGRMSASALSELDTRTTELMSPYLALVKVMAERNNEADKAASDAYQDLEKQFSEWRTTTHSLLKQYATVAGVTLDKEEFTTEEIQAILEESVSTVRAEPTAEETETDVEPVTEETESETETETETDAPADDETA